MNIIQVIFDWVIDVIAFSRDFVVFQADPLSSDFWSINLTLFDCIVGSSVVLVILKIFGFIEKDDDIFYDDDD